MKVYARTLGKKLKPFLRSSEAIIVTGMRRTGKTTLLKEFFDQTESENKIILDLENPLNQKLFEEDNYESIKKSLEFLGIDFRRKPHIFLDEIQFLKGLPSVVKYFIDHYQVKFFLTGSAAFYLKNVFAESLAGRKYVFELFPLSFKEFLTFKEASLSVPAAHKTVTEPVFNIFRPLYEEYLRFGGFPGVVLKDSVECMFRA